MHVIDMQNAFMLPGVGFVEIKTAPEIVPNINRLAAAVRSAGATVVWIAMTRMMLNYRVVMVTDANAADTDADHNAALCAFYSTFGDVMPTDMVVDLLK